MKRLLSLLTLLALPILVLVLAPSAAMAAKPTASSNTKPAKSSTTELVGYDISWPQCDKKLPKGQAFGVVGVNGGTAANTNPCLAEQLVWANKSTGKIVAQPKVQLYVNTANPAQDSTYNWASWPTTSTSNNPYGVCTGGNDLACSWQYGWNRSAEADLDRFVPAAQIADIGTNAGDYTWWLDVETTNSWQAGSTDALARNTAAIEGFAAYYQSKGATVGLYSTAVQWGAITGSSVSPSSNLNGLANWRPSGASLSNAINNCSVDPLTANGFISLTQYVQQNLDKNHSCI